MTYDQIHMLHDLTVGRRKASLSTESDLIRYFTSAVRTTLDDSVIVPPGDDAAVVSPTPGMELINTVDVLVESVDFNFSYASPDDIGYKAIMVNVSDIAAMRGRPRWVTVALGLRDIQVDVIEGLTAGFITACKESGACLVGGDITSSQAMLLSVNIVGEVAPGRAVTRCGAKEGMLILLTGPLGSSYAGYKLLSSKDQPRVRKRTFFVLRREHLRPRARFDLVPYLEQVEVGAMIDISDGFLVDLKRLLQASGVAGEVTLPLIPILAETHEAADEVGGNPMKWALRGGEDFELIICLTDEEYAKLIRTLPRSSLAPIPVGRIIEGNPGEMRLLDQRGKQVVYNEIGFDHFAKWEVV